MRLLLFLFCLCGFWGSVGADVEFVLPQPGAILHPGPINISWRESGNLPLIEDYASMLLCLYTGSNSQMTPVREWAIDARSLSCTVCIEATAAPSDNGPVFFFGIQATLSNTSSYPNTSIPVITNFSGRFSLADMAGANFSSAISAANAGVTGTAAPPTETQLETLEEVAQDQEAVSVISSLQTTLSNGISQISTMAYSAVASPTSSLQTITTSISTSSTLSQAAQTSVDSDSASSTTSTPSPQSQSSTSQHATVIAVPVSLCFGFAVAGVLFFFLRLRRRKHHPSKDLTNNSDSSPRNSTSGPLLPSFFKRSDKEPNSGQRKNWRNGLPFLSRTSVTEIPGYQQRALANGSQKFASTAEYPDPVFELGGDNGAEPRDNVDKAEREAERRIRDMLGKEKPLWEGITGVPRIVAPNAKLDVKDGRNINDINWLVLGDPQG